MSQKRIIYCCEQEYEEFFKKYGSNPNVEIRTCPDFEPDVQAARTIKNDYE